MTFLFAQAEDMPPVFLALFIQHPIPFLEEFFENIGRINYPKERMDLFIHYSVSTETHSTLYYTNQNSTH